MFALTHSIGDIATLATAVWDWGEKPIEIVGKIGAAAMAVAFAYQYAAKAVRNWFR